MPASSAPAEARGGRSACQVPRGFTFQGRLRHKTALTARSLARCAPPSSPAPSRRLRGCALTASAHPSSTTHSRGHPQPPALCSKEASQSSPALEAPAPSRCGHHPGGDGAEVSFSKCMRHTDPASIPLGAPEARRGLRHRAGTGCRVPDPVITRACVVQRRAQSCLPYGLPARSRSNARTALDFRSGVDPCERMTLRTRTDPPVGERPDLFARCPTCPRGNRRHPSPWSQKCADGAGSRVHF